MATNTVYERLFGGPAAEIPSEDVAGLPFAPDDRPQQRAARGERFRVEFAVSDPDGKRRWFEAVAEPLTASDRTWGGVVSIRDISERTMRLSLERLMAAAGHELKTPTAAIHNYLQLVERRLASGDTAEAATYAARAVVQAQRLNELIERLYDVSRIQTGQLEIVSRPMDLAASRARRSIWPPCCRTRPDRFRCPPGHAADPGRCGPSRAGRPQSARQRDRARDRDGGDRGRRVGVLTATPRSVSVTTARASRPRTWPACSMRTPGRGTRARRVSGSAFRGPRDRHRPRWHDHRDV